MVGLCFKNKLQKDNISFSTAIFEIDAPGGSQWPFENHDPLGAMAENSETSISSSLFLVWEKKVRESPVLTGLGTFQLGRSLCRRPWYSKWNTLHTVTQTNKGDVRFQGTETVCLRGWRRPRENGRLVEKGVLCRRVFVTPSPSSGPKK